jgi:uncharacterized protein YPO0396
VDNYLPFARSPRPGYRLQKLEVFNWGTFDSSRGSVYTIRPEGQNALLVGQNGSGKSTLVDALLTLLVRPVVRNYNVAAGARKQERDERTYIKGAYGRTSREEDNRGEAQYLRPEGKHYSALLATFVNEDRNKAFSVAQVLYLNSDGRAEKVYCLAPGERSLASDCSGFATMERLPKQMEERGWRATKTYKDFHHWFAKLTGMKPKAMDMFNQTVAVKDIQSLTEFIRQHMLEANPWGEKVEDVLRHFALLSEAHQSLIRVRKQAELLEPIARHGQRFRQQDERLAQTLRLIAAADCFFDTQIVELFGPHCELLDRQRQTAADNRDELAREAHAVREEIRRLQNEIETAGGERLRQIPLLIEQHQLRARTAREEQHRYQETARRAGVERIPSHERDFAALRETLPTRRSETDAQLAATQTQRDELVLSRAATLQSLHNDRQELESLASRQGNLPRHLVELRKKICQELHLSENDLPFVAELIRVDADARDWESSIEMVLRPLALSMLAPDRHYRVVSAHVERTRLADEQGRGQRLVYLRVGQRQRANDSRPHPREHSLLTKLNLREGHALLPWLRGELADRFDYLCCDTIEQFNEARGLALTRHRHIKSGSVRHEKDDRARTSDPRFFVLGWDNREKRNRLALEIQQQEGEIGRVQQQIEQQEKRLGELQQRRAAIEQLESFADYRALDCVPHDREVAALVREKEELENQSDALRILRQRLGEAQQQAADIDLARDEAVGLLRELENQIKDGRRLIANAQSQLEKQRQQADWGVHEQCFADLREHFAEHPLTALNLMDQRPRFTTTYHAKADQLRARLEPLRVRVCHDMNRFLRTFGEERSDLDATVEHLTGFLALRDQIQREDLPRHEQRFKERLNEKVTQEIGILNGALQTERSEIEGKIALLNTSLRQLEYRPGTHMRLEARLVRDREIHEFRNALAECLAGAFEGTFEADEARYRQIEKLVNRLREEQRWRDKVTDVRRWFDFAAVEIDDESGEQRAYYEDSAGQSGGEKAKLAFTILVAAIAYQYDIDPQQPESDRFHFVVVDEMFSKVDDRYAEYALELFNKFGLQLLIVAPLDAKARVTEPHVGCYAHVVKDAVTNQSEILSITAQEFEEVMVGADSPSSQNGASADWSTPRTPK